MARISSKMTMLFNLLLLLSLCFTVAIAERILKIDTPISTGLQCEFVHGVKSGDTCLSVASKFNLTPRFFATFNPNLNCDELFVGQWLCTQAIGF
ncbi:hypothetical protein NL676_012994 [Syzygium grande]|nr:hypothetical protein NL676_012994 [Syzygium grande]